MPVTATTTLPNVVSKDSFDCQKQVALMQKDQVDRICLLSTWSLKLSNPIKKQTNFSCSIIIERVRTECLNLP